MATAAAFVLAIPVAIVAGIFFWARWYATRPKPPPPFEPLAQAAEERTIKANFPDVDEFTKSYALRLMQAWEYQIPVLPVFNRILDTAAEIYEMEQLYNPLPPVTSSDPIAIGRYKDDLNRHMEKIADAPRVLGIVTDGITRSLQSLRDALPRSALQRRQDLQATIGSPPPAMTVPIFDVIEDVPKLTYDVAIAFYTDEIRELRLFEGLKAQLDRNDTEASGGSGRYVRPWEYQGTPRKIVNVYLAGTPLHALFDEELPFSLPDEARFAGHWILSPPGRGKTTLLHAMVMDDLKKQGACLILMDSKGDFIDPIRNLKAIEDRLVIIDPDPKNPVAINPLDIAHADLAQSVDLLEYLFASLLEFKMTAMQTTLFRSVLRALVTAFPNPTLETFRDLLTNGTAKYEEYIKKLPPDLQDFFYNDFPERNYADRRREVLQRLRLLLDNETMRAMLTAASTRFHISQAMDTGKIVIINNSKARLGDQGAEFFGRFFIAQVLAAAQQRSARPADKKPPVYFYIDECQNVIARDEKIPTILDECRSQNIALIMAHQRTRQISSENVLDALSNCAIRFANSDEEARFLAPRLRTSPDFLQSLGRGKFAGFVRDMTPHAVSVSVNRVDFREHLALSAVEQAALAAQMRQSYGAPLHLAPPAEPPAPPPPTEEPPPPDTPVEERPRQAARRRKEPPLAKPEAASDWR